MGITVDNYVKMYKTNKKGKDNTFEDFLKRHITTDYVEFLKKDAICEGIVKATSYVKEEKSEREFIKINSSMRYIFFTMKLIEIYTDIEIDGNNMADQYDKLCKVGAIDDIINSLPENEYDEFRTILNMKLDDLFTNEYSDTALLYNFKKTLSLSEEVINSAIETLTREVKTEKE